METTELKKIERCFACGSESAPEGGLEHSQKLKISIEHDFNLIQANIAAREKLLNDLNDAGVVRDEEIYNLRQRNQILEEKLKLSARSDQYPL